MVTVVHYSVFLIFHFIIFRADNDTKTIKDLTEHYRKNTNFYLLNRASSIRDKLWLFLDEPSSSKYAKVVASRDENCDYNFGIISFTSHLYRNRSTYSFAEIYFCNNNNNNNDNNNNKHFNHLILPVLFQEQRTIHCCS